MKAPAVSVVIATYNRAPLLQRALEALLRQAKDSPYYEIIVVDNNSSDNTAEVVRALRCPAHATIRYLVERRQGNAFARNTGIEHASASVVAFTDDDVCVAPDWIRTITDALPEGSRWSFIGGVVLPEKADAAPDWLTRECWAPLGAVDYGPESFEVREGQMRCLLTANLAVRRTALERIGHFEPRLQRVRDEIGSLEDHDLIVRLCGAGERGHYVPHMKASTYVAPERLTKRYHRRWHRGHGKFYALLRDPDMERSRATLLRAPIHIYRTIMAAIATWVVAVVRVDATTAFRAEMEIWFSLGFLRQRAGEAGNERGGSVAVARAHMNVAVVTSAYGHD